MVKLQITFAAVIVVCLTLSACAPITPPSIWEPVVTLARAEQSHAPALWVRGNTVTATWIGADPAGVHQDARLRVGRALTVTISLPLPPVQPYGQVLLPADGERYHLLWLDVAENGQSRLYTALLDYDLSVERGPIALSDQRAGRFTASASGDGSALILWSGGLIAEPTIHVQTISVRGIPQEPTPLLTAADWPMLIQANDGTRHLVWMDTHTQQFRYGQLTDGELTINQPTPNGLNLTEVERLHNLQLALDSTHLYLFWNLTRLTGQDEAWYTARALDSEQWNRPQRLGIGTPMDTFIQTGFNSGPVHTVQSGENWLMWAAPLAGQFDVLPVAVSQQDEIGIVYLQGATISGYQSVTTLQKPLIGRPMLRTDRDRYLYLAWAEPTTNGKAQLQLADTRP